MDDREKAQLGELLSAYLDGEVTPEQRAQVEAKLESDVEARELLSELEHTVSLVHELPRVAAPPSIAEEITSRLERAALLGNADEDDAFSRRRGRPLRSVMAFAAMIAIAVGGGLYVSWQLAESEAPDTRYAGANRLSDMEEESSSIGRARDITNTDAMKMPASRSAHEVKERKAERSVGGTDLDRRALAKKGLIQEPSDTSSADGEADFSYGNPFEDLFAQLESTATSDTERVEAPAVSSFTEDEVAVSPTAPALAGLEGQGTAGSLRAAGQTLEQAFAAGENLQSIRQHDFENEPLRLTIAFADTNGQNAFDRRLQRVLADNRIEPLDRPLRAGALILGGRADEIVSPEVAESGPPRDSRVFYRGSEPFNYQTQSSGEVQYVIRTPAAVVQQLVDISLKQLDAEPELRIGMLTATGRNDLANLAGALHADSDSPAAQNGDTGVTLDVLELIEAAGLAPSGIFNSDWTDRGRRPRRGIEPQGEKDDQYAPTIQFDMDEQPADASRQEPLMTLLVRLVSTGADSARPIDATTNGVANPLVP